MQGWFSNHFDLRPIGSRERDMRGVGGDDAERVRWSPPRSTVVIIGTIAVALVVWLAYALGWLP
jgi:hypothetical protein